MLHLNYNVETTGSRRDDESDSMVYHGDSGRDEDLDNDNDNDYFEIQEHEDDDVDQDVYYRDRNSNGESIKSQNSIRSIPEPRAMLQQSIENVLYRSEEQNNPDVNSHALSLYHTDEYQRNRDLYESWKYQQSLVAVQPTAVAATELALTQLESAPMLELQSVLQAASVVIICAFLSYVSVSPRSLPLIEYNKAYKDGLLRVFCSLIWPSIILSQLSSSTVNINDIIGNFMKSFSLGYPSLVALELVVVTALRMIVLGYVSHVKNVLSLCFTPFSYCSFYSYHFIE